MIDSRLIEAVKIGNIANLPTKHGIFKIQVVIDQKEREHIIIYKGEVTNKENVPVRIHSECLTSEVFNSLRCDCNEQLEAALNYFESEGIGVLIYLRQEGRGIGLFNKIEAYVLQDKGLDTVEANLQLGFPVDLRTYEIAINIMKILKIKSVRILTNNPKKIDILKKHGITVTECIPMRVQPNSFNNKYLKTKKEKMNHIF